jgi:hypothetical protein
MKGLQKQVFCFSADDGGRLEVSQALGPRSVTGTERVAAMTVITK